MSDRRSRTLYRRRLRMDHRPGGAGHASAWYPPDRPLRPPWVPTWCSSVPAERINGSSATVPASSRFQVSGLATRHRGVPRTQGGLSLMSEPEVRQTPPGPAAEAGTSPVRRPGPARHPSASPRSGTRGPAPAVPPPGPPQPPVRAGCAAGSGGRHGAVGDHRDAKEPVTEVVKPRRAGPGRSRGRGQALARTPALGGAGPPHQAGRPLPGLRARPAPDDPDRHARGALAGRALRVPGGRRHDPDRRERLPGPGAERASGHGGGLRRHRDPEERRAVPGRRALRQATTSRAGASSPAPDRGRAQGGTDHLVPGHQEPDRGQGRPPDPGGVPPRALRRAGAQLERLRDLQAAG